MRTRLRLGLLGLFCLGLFGPSVATARAADDTITSRSGAIDFTLYVKALFTVKQEGQFKSFEGQVAYDPADPAAMHLDLVVYTASVDTKDSGHDELLRSPDFFDVGRYPTMRFLSTSVNVLRNGELAVMGDLTIHGITKRLEVPVTVRRMSKGGGAADQFETTFEIDRTEFGLNGSPKVGPINVSVGKKVRIHLAIVAPLRSPLG